MARRRKPTREEAAAGLTEVTEVHAGVAMAANSTLGPRREAMVREIEAAMTAAVRDAVAEGLDLTADAAAVRDRMQAARLAVKDRWGTAGRK